MKTVIIHSVSCHSKPVCCFLVENKRRNSEEYLCSSFPYKDKVKKKKNITNVFLMKCSEAVRYCSFYDEQKFMLINC